MGWVFNFQIVSVPLTHLHSESVFGPPSAPSARLESLIDGGKVKLGELKKRGTKKGKGHGIVWWIYFSCRQLTNSFFAAVPLPISASAAGTKNIATVSVPGHSGLKRVTTSKSAK